MKLTAEEEKIVKSILQSTVPNCEVWAFGSRVHGHNLKKFSDLDLVVVADSNLELNTFTNLKHSFSQSDLPFKVDVVEWHSISPKFKDIIKAKYEIVQQAKN